MFSHDRGFFYIFPFFSSPSQLRARGREVNVHSLIMFCCFLSLRPFPWSQLFANVRLEAVTEPARLTKARSELSCDRLRTAGFPRSRLLSRPWPRRGQGRLLRLGTGLNAFGIGRLAFPAVSRWLSVRLARLTRRRTAEGGNASESVAWLRLLSLTFEFRAWLWVLWDDRNGCSDPRSTPATSTRNITHVLVHWESCLQGF